MTRPKCDDCGSFYIVWDAWVSWDPVERKHVVGAVFDHCECGDCGSENLKEVSCEATA